MEEASLSAAFSMAPGTNPDGSDKRMNTKHTDTQRSWDRVAWQCLCWRNQSTPETRHISYKQSNRDEGLLPTAEQGCGVITYR